MSVLEASLDEVRAVLSTINRSNAEAYRKIIPPEYFKEPVFSLDELSKKFDEMIFYTYRIEKRIVGVAALQIINDDLGQVRFVYVLPEHQRKGVGTSLVTYIEDEARKHRLKRLGVPFVNEKAEWAIAFYKKLGYRMTGSIKKPWGDDIYLEKAIL